MNSFSFKICCFTSFLLCENLFAAPLELFCNQFRANGGSWGKIAMLGTNSLYCLYQSESTNFKSYLKFPEQKEDLSRRFRFLQKNRETIDPLFTYCTSYFPVVKIDIRVNPVNELPYLRIVPPDSNTFESRGIYIDVGCPEAISPPQSHAAFVSFCESNLVVHYSPRYKNHLLLNKSFYPTGLYYPEWRSDLYLVPFEDTDTYGKRVQLILSWGDEQPDVNYPRYWEHKHKQEGWALLSYLHSHDASLPPNEIQSLKILIADVLTRETSFQGFMTLSKNTPNVHDIATVVLTPSSFDFGEVTELERPVLTATLRNDGDKIVHVTDVVRTCVCADLDLSTTNLPPGGSAEVRCTLDPNVFSGPFQKTFFIKTDDPATPSITIPICGTVRELWEVDPDKWFQIRASDTNAVLRVKAAPDAPALVRSEVLGPDGATFEFLPIGEREWEAVFTPGDLPQGQHHWTVNLYPESSAIPALGLHFGKQSGERWKCVPARHSLSAIESATMSPE